jgi:ATP-dependent DNA helicase RecG
VRKARTGKDLGKVVVTDGTATLHLTFFGRTAQWQCARLKPGSEHLFAGVVSVFNEQRQLTHPEVFLDADEDTVARASKVIPIYPAKTGLGSPVLQRSVDIVLAQVDLDDLDPLPLELRLEHDLMGLREALETVHTPVDVRDVPAAQARLRWDEALVLQVVLARKRAELRRQGGTPRGGRLGGLLDLYDAGSPFVLTDGQDAVGRTLFTELGRAHPMHRLLQGEVGSGKTVVALRAMLTVVDSGGQAALLAPTEVLAQQHARSLRQLLGPLATAGELGSPEVATRVTLLTGSVQGAARKRALAEIGSGEAGIVVGTHALLSEGVDFHDLGLVVVDEQHRFGVEQRDALRAKGTHPHVLVMTATPIPRTVAMTVFGDLEVSTLRELPRGRSPITTRVARLRSEQFREAMDLVRSEVSAGRQAFVVCPRIGDEEPAKQADDKRPPLSVVEVVETLRKHYLPGLRVEALHGRMPSDTKDEVMGRFAQGDIEVLVSTTVIEVGVDVPNATVMVVMDAERFGISQLHQLRGRIGRGGHAGTCVLATALEPSAPAAQRLAAVAATTDGFALSELDLEVRREGDVLGTDQSGGRSSLNFLTLADLDVLTRSRDLATAIVEADPDLHEHPALKLAVAAILDEERKAFIEKT